MRVSLVAFLGLLTLAVAASHAADVREVNGSASFGVALRAAPLVFVKFYHPKCPHCQAIAPVFAAVAGAAPLRARRDLLRFAAVDISEERNREAFNTHSPDGVPTLKLFRDGRVQAAYGGARTRDAMVRWLQGRVLRHLAPPVSRLRTAAARDRFLAKFAGSTVVLAYVDGDRELSAEFDDVAFAARQAAGSPPLFASVSDVSLLGSAAVAAARRVYAAELRAVVLRNATLQEGATSGAWWVPGVLGGPTLRSFIALATATRDGALLTPVLAEALVDADAVLYVFGDRSAPDETTQEMLQGLGKAAGGRALVVYAHDRHWKALMRHVGLLPTSDEQWRQPRPLRLALHRAGANVSEKAVFTEEGRAKRWLAKQVTPGAHDVPSGTAGELTLIGDDAWHATFAHTQRIVLLVVCGEVQAACDTLRPMIGALRPYARSVLVLRYVGRQLPPSLNGQPLKLSMSGPIFVLVPPGEKPRFFTRSADVEDAVRKAIAERAGVEEQLVPLRNTDAYVINMSLVGAGLVVLGSALALHSCALAASSRMRLQSDKSV